MAAQAELELTMRYKRASLLLLAFSGMLPAMSADPADCSEGPATGAGCPGVTAAPAGAETAISTDFLWVTNDANYGTGTVSKVSKQAFPSGTKYREVARYASVTCLSDPVNGSKEGAVFSATPPATLCGDGTHGCCSRDETVPGANGLHQPVNLVQNRPVRAAVDINGHAWVVNAANGAFSLQSSVTLIAGSQSECFERNGIPGIQTSTDANGDGIIETDCNNDGVADDATDVNGGSPCLSGHPQEFWGLDDECVLFTVNIGATGDVARALALGRGASVGAPSDAWIGTYANGKFYRIDGTTGTIKQTVTIGSIGGKDPHPYGAVIDQFGILWTENVSTDGGCTSGCLFYFDTANTANQDVVTSSIAGGGFNGIALDGYRDVTGLRQQIWLGAYGDHGAYRYRPVRGTTFNQIRNGTWALGEVSGTAQFSSARGLAVDSRTPAYAWVAFDGGEVGKIPANMPDGTNTISSANLYITGQNTPVGIGIGIGQDVWTANEGSSTLTHFSVDASGNVTNSASPDQLDLDDIPGANENFCPHPMFGLCKPHPDTNSDFTGFAFLTFTYPGIDRIFADDFQ